MSSRDYQRVSAWLISTLSAAACAVAQPTATPPASPQAPLACERWFADADAKLKQGQAADALVLYELAAKECPDNPRVQLRIAMSAQQAGKKGQAGEALRHFLELKPEAATDLEVKELARAIGTLDPPATDQATRKSLSGGSSKSDRPTTDDRSSRLALATAADTLADYSRAPAGRQIELRPPLQSAIGQLLITTEGRPDIDGWKLVGLAAESLDDNELAAIAFAAIETEAPDYLSDPSLSQIMVRLNRRPLQPSTQSIGKSTSAHRAAVGKWVVSRLGLQLAEQLFGAAKSGDAASVRHLARWIDLASTLEWGVDNCKSTKSFAAMVQAGLDTKSVNLVRAYREGVFPCNIEWLVILLRSGVSVNGDGKDATKSLLYHLCTLEPSIASVHSEAVRLLLDHGADVGLSDEAGRSALHQAVLTEQCDVIKMLLKAGAVPSKQDIRGKTALHACFHEDVVLSREVIVKMLLDAGVDVNVVDVDGNSAIHLAARKKYHLDEAARMLIESPRIKPNLRNSSGWTPLDIAAGVASGTRIDEVRCSDITVNFLHCQMRRRGFKYAAELR